MIHRNILASAILFLSVPFVAKSQVMGTFTPFLNAGVKVGGSFQQLSGAPVKPAPGLVAGIYVSKSLGRLGVRAELLGTTARYTTKYLASFYTPYYAGLDTTNKGDFQALYINVPLLVDYKLTEKLQILGGIQLGYVASLKDKNNAFTNIYGDNSFIKTTDFSIVAGAELGLTKRIKLGARVLKGVSDVNNSKYYLKAKSWTTTGLQVSVSYKIL